MASNENSCKLKLNEFDETFSDDVAENTKVINIILVTFFTMNLALLIVSLIFVILIWQMTQKY